MSMTRKTETRQEPRPETVITRYWYPKRQQWLSLNEATYLKSLDTEAKA